ncbi:MAG: GH3 auxin-responsive promoter family protein [Flavobacteriales bacterium]|nr:GH3 auxin-responsive promoter family protein [Flavobacteriales bacterium]MDG2246453.1 GH3 auxin-responsive promoter family protein [Flavobacteriales bacterium]
MPFNTFFSWVIKKRLHQIELFRKYPMEVQMEWFERLIAEGRDSDFGKDHGLGSVSRIQDFKKAVPIRNYDALRPYIDRLRDGEQGVLWPSRVKWFAKSSGTTSDISKYIPVTREALEDCHYKGGKDLLAMYCQNVPDGKPYSGKSLVMGGSSNIHSINDEAFTGDLSAIIIENLPIWVELRRTPNKEIALLDNWEEKIEKMALATMNEDVSILCGVPSWSLVLLKRIMELKGASSILEVWPNLELFMHGGVSFKPYKSQFEKLIPKTGMNYVESYNASEGFFGIQDTLHGDDLLLMLDYGIFYEFMPMSEFGKEDPETVLLEEVEIGQNYALVISTNAGLWRYLIGDTVRFTSKAPYRIQVSGRTRHYINAFGEELIIENADEAIKRASVATGARVNDYSACPVYMTDAQTGAHEWMIEFDKAPQKLEHFTKHLDTALKEVNSDYSAKRSFDLNLREPIVHQAPCGTFYEWMKSRGKIGGQNKVPRLSNERIYMDDLLSFVNDKKETVTE